MNIKQAKIEDLKKIIKLNKIDDYGNPDCFIEDSIKNRCVFVAEIKNAIVGFSLYQVLWGNTAFLALIKVHPDYQGKGIGTKLLQTTEKKLKDDSVSSLCSSTEKKNIPAQKFHKKNDFIHIGTLDMHHGPEVFYGKEL